MPVQSYSHIIVGDGLSTASSDPMTVRNISKRALRVQTRSGKEFTSNDSTQTSI
jgi:hypothetical protein